MQLRLILSYVLQHSYWLQVYWLAYELTEGKEQFIVGGEESYGYLVGDHVRDKMR